MAVYADEYTYEKFINTVLSGIRHFYTEPSFVLEKWTDLGLDIEYFYREEPAIPAEFTHSFVIDFGKNLVFFTDYGQQSYYVTQRGSLTFESTLSPFLYSSNVNELGLDTSRNTIDISLIHLSPYMNFFTNDIPERGTEIFMYSFPYLYKSTFYGPVYVSEGMSNDFINYLYGEP